MISQKKKQKCIGLRRAGRTLEQISKGVTVSAKTVSAILQGTRRVVILSDSHCGDKCGLTPPEWQYDPDNEPHKKDYSQQVEMWNWYEGIIESLRPIDVLIVNGDCTAGKGERSGGTELIEADRHKQAEIAARCFSIAHAPKIIMTFGTPYHCGVTEDFESQVCTKLQKNAIVTIEGHAFFDINGFRFDVKHFIAGSTIPQGRFSAIARAKLWNILWGQHDQQPSADIIIRSHVHRFSQCGDSDWIGITTPALQGWGSKFGARICEQTIDFGLIWMDIPAAGTIQDIQWKAEIPKLDCHKVITTII
jgi:hypothetical protein